MTTRDRMVLIAVVVLVLLAGGWVLVVSPERTKAGAEQAQVQSARQQLETAKSQANSARAAEQRYDAAYSSRREPRQSGAGRRGSALADLPARTGVRPARHRIHLDHLGQLRGSSGSSSASALGRGGHLRHARRIYPDAVHVRLQR